MIHLSTINDDERRSWRDQQRILYLGNRMKWPCSELNLGPYVFLFTTRQYYDVKCNEQVKIEKSVIIYRCTIMSFMINLENFYVFIIHENLTFYNFGTLKHFLHKLYGKIKLIVIFVI